MTNQAKYDERLKRIDDAVSMKIPDRVPCMPFPQTYPFLHAGHTMKEIMYDAKKAREDIRNYMLEYEPDLFVNYAPLFAGQGPMLEKLGIKWLQWAGQPGSRVSDTSIHQYIEKNYLKDDEYPELLSDISGWIWSKWLPRSFTTMECLKDVSIRSLMSYQTVAVTPQFINPQIVEVFKMLAEVGEMAIRYYGEHAQFEQEMADLGFPGAMGGLTTTAFDMLSDTLRGTIDTMADLYDQPENVLQAVEMFYPTSLDGAVKQAKRSKGKFVFIPLHKGLDGFMGPEQYNKFYWPTLKRLVEDLIKEGCTPWIYTEGKYDSRLETIADVPAGKVLFHFENVDMKEAKRIIGKDHCISGGFSSQSLRKGTPKSVSEEIKRLLDIVAVDGGYIFDLSDTMDDAPAQNVEAMFNTVKTYGKY